MRIVFAFAGLLSTAMYAVGQGNSVSNPDSATFDPDGTAHITRVVAMPSTVSPEAQKWLTEIEHEEQIPTTLAERRAHTDQWQRSQSAEAKRLFPVNVEPQTIAGVRTDIITPLITLAQNLKRVLINLHGGGFNSDSGSLIEGIPICNLAKIKVVSVYYRLAPENPFPAAVDDVVAVYKELLKTYQPGNIGIFGTSAGGILNGRSHSQAQATWAAIAWRSRPFHHARGLQPDGRFAAVVCLEWILRGHCSAKSESRP